MAFPPEFIWGAATSAYQVEGAVDKHGRGESIWDAFCRKPGAIEHGHTGNRACDHVLRYRDDVALMNKLGLDAYRLSVAWPRVIPEGTGAVSETGLAFYDRLIDELLGAGIEPWVTLYHWDLPLELHRRGGWQSAESPWWFAEYAHAVVDRLSDRVANWMTLNEPQVFISLGYCSGQHAPGLALGEEEVVPIAHHVMMAHGLATRAIREAARTRPRIG